MGTSNFHNVNANQIFAVKLEDEWDYYDLKDNLLHEFKKLDYDERKNERPEDELRSYPAVVLCLQSKFKKINDVEVGVSIRVIIRNGYYEGCNLDWLTNEYINGNWQNTIEVTEIAEALNEEIEEDERVKTISEFQSFIETTKNELITEVEKVFQEFSTPLKIKARFSNGETIYEKVN
jgi:hypothetical protein